MKSNSLLYKFFAVFLALFLAFGALVRAEAAPHLAVITYQAKSYIFLRLPGPTYLGQQLGHVGWGYELRKYSDGVLSNTTYYFGAVENPNGQPYVAPGSYNGGWWSTATTGQSMFNVMKAYGYQYYKFTASFFAVTQTQVNSAYATATNMAARGYQVNGNNCMNAAYDVLNALGTSGLAWPSTNWVPKNWYNNTTSGWSTSRNIP